jgi:hypothetical protein
MKTLFSAKKTIVSAGAVLLAAALIIGGTYAWLIVGGGENGFDEPTPTGRLEIETFGFNVGDISEDAQYAIQPGMQYSNSDGYIKNPGSIAAFVEIEPIEVILVSDSKGRPSATTSSSVGVALAGFTIDPADPANDHYVYSDDSLTALSEPGAVYHWVLRDEEGNITRQFLDMQASGDYNLYDWDPVAEEEIYLGSIHRDVGVKVQTYIDLWTNRAQMGPEWNGFHIKGFNVKATQAMYEEAIMDSLGLTQQELRDLDWLVPTPDFGPLSFSASKSHTTPYEILQAQFAAAL